MTRGVWMILNGAMVLIRGTPAGMHRDSGSSLWILLALIGECLRPGLQWNFRLLMVCVEIKKVRQVVSLPDPGKVGFSVGCFRRRSRKIRLAVPLSRSQRIAVVHPLCRG